MGTIAKTLLGVFFLLLVTITGIQTVMGAADVSEAQNYHADAVTQIECSNFNPQVISACVSQASEAGYELSITPITYDASGNQRTAEVVLKYKYGIKLLELSEPKCIRGFAR